MHAAEKLPYEERLKPGLGSVEETLEWGGQEKGLQPTEWQRESAWGCFPDGLSQYKNEGSQHKTMLSVENEHQERLFPPAWHEVGGLVATMCGGS